MSHKMMAVWLGMVAVATACVPAVAHGPRVRPGFSGGVSASLTTGKKYPDGDSEPKYFLYGPVGVNVGYGWAPVTTGLPALRLGVHVPVPVLALVQPDIYVQAPRSLSREFDFGIGVSWWAIERGRVAMPYVQFGRIGENGSGWYTTQGYFRNTKDTQAQSRPVLSANAWVPGIAYQFEHGGSTTHVFVAAILGTQFMRCNVYTNTICGRERRSGAFAGITLERHQRRDNVRP